MKKIIQSKEHRIELASIKVSVTILGHAGFLAAGILKTVDKLANSKTQNGSVVLRQRLQYEYDAIFAETAALCFYLAMHQFWKGDAGEFCVLDDPDGTNYFESDYLESLIEALDFADDIVSDISSKIPKTYIRLRALSYEEEPGATDHASDWFAVNVVKPIFPNPEPAALLLATLCMTAADDMGPDKLDALCRLAWLGEPL
ncbi:MAG: hypothetical protein HIU93_16300 [Acidobacteria bacterium]|nr:hypothetical protein [Acidobacteriota bacterium]